MIKSSFINKNIAIKKQNLKHVIKTHCYKEGNFTLTSGEKSNKFFDLK